MERLYIFKLPGAYNYYKLKLIKVSGFNRHITGKLIVTASYVLHVGLGPM